MGGIHFAEMTGAFIRWLFFGCRKPYKVYLDDAKNESGVPRNFILGLIVLFGLLIAVFY